VPTVVPREVTEAVPRVTVSERIRLIHAVMVTAGILVGVVVGAVGWAASKATLDDVQGAAQTAQSVALEALERHSRTVEGHAYYWRRLEEHDRAILDLSAEIKTVKQLQVWQAEQTTEIARRVGARQVPRPGP
jgi:hypothetical protein